MSNVYNYDIKLLSRVNLPDAVDFTQGITIHAGYYWMTSNRYKTVSKLTLNLDVLHTFSVESQTDLPLGIAHDGEHLWIVGTDKDKVLKYTEQGAYTGVSFSTLAQVDYADGICWDGYHFWVVGTGNFNAYKYTHDGVYTGVNFPLQVVDGTVRDITWGGDSFWVISSTSTGGKINRYNADGSYESDEFESLPAHGIYYYGGQLHAVGSSSSELFIFSVETELKTYKETILATEGLLGYYPLYVDGKDISDIGNDMEAIGNVEFGDDALSPDGVGCYLSKTSTSLSDILTVNQNANSLSMEIWVSTETFPSGIFGLNQMIDNTVVDYRSMVLAHVDEDIRMRSNGQVSVSQADPYSFTTPKHVVMQYEPETNTTALYIDGELSASTPNNGFASLQENGKILTGSFTDTEGNSIVGGSKTSDFAIYNRPLTRSEIWERAFFKPIDPNSPDPFGDGSLLAKYRLDGDATDLTGNYHGTATNVTYKEENFGQCGVFNGVNSKVSCPFLLQGGEFTFSKFVKSNDVTIQQRSGYSESSKNIYFRLAINNSKVELYFHHDLNPLLMVSGTTLSDNTWYHIAGVFRENGNTELYVNGELEATQVTGNLVGLPEIENGFHIGTGRNPNGSFWDGSIDQVEIYNRALTESEIYRLYKQSSGSDPIVNLLLSLSSITWSNRETKAQANPQPIYLEHHGIVPFDSTYAVKNNPFYADPIVDQNSKLREFGYIASTTQIGGVPIGDKRVMLFAHDNGMFLDETVSDSAGNYRFNSLLMSKKYMVTAQYGNADKHTPPDYSATSSDWQTPIAYGVEKEPE